MHTRPSTILALAATIAACGDAAAPTRAVTLSFCSGITWAGVQSEGRGWVTIANGVGDYTVDATERLVVATITDGLDPQLAFYYLTRDQAQETFACSDVPAGTRDLRGSVAGTSGGFTYVAMGGTVGVTSSAGFSLSGLPDGPLDLVAVNAGKAIVRRGVTYPSGATIPVLDFSSAEAFALQSHTLSIEPTAPGGARWQTWIMTSGGTIGPLTINAFGAGGTIYTLPASHQGNDDLYHLSVASGSVGEVRLVERFYDTPSNQVVSLGPLPSRPTYTTVAAAGQLWRVEIPSQPEYTSQIELRVDTPQPSTSTASMVIRASREYFGGTPTTWAFTVPDLSSVTGFPAGWPMLSPSAGGQVTASDAPWGFSPSRARTGDAYRSATGSS